MLSTPEGLTTARALADAYMASTASQHQGCPTANIYVYGQPVNEARRALRNGWAADELAVLGPRPDLWLPESTRHDLGNVAEASNGELKSAQVRLLAATPLVLAVPAGALPAELRTRRAELSWAEVLRAVDDLGWGVARPDPARSVTGEFATIAMYASGQGDPDRLGDPARLPELVSPAGARRIESLVARGMDRGGYPLGDATELLCRQRTVETVGALVVTEQQLVRFNAGQPVGDGCTDNGPVPSEKALMAVYPRDTLSLDHPVVTLDWRHASVARTEQIATFRRWLTGDPAKGVLAGQGLRPADWPGGDLLSDRFGALSGVEYSKVRPSGRVLDVVTVARSQAQRPGRVLLLLDASGSMREPAGPAGSRLDVAKQGVVDLARQMGDRDEFGVWVFQGPQRTPRPLLPISRNAPNTPNGSHRATLTTALATVQANGNTPLHRAIVEGVRVVGPANENQTSALVVLTDGVDEGSGVTTAQLVAAASASGVRVFVVAVGEARCAAQALRAVTEATAGTCYQTDFASLDGQLGRLFDTLWTGDGK